MIGTIKFRLIVTTMVLLFTAISCGAPQKRVAVKDGDGIHYSVDFKRDEIESYGAPHLHKGADRAAALERLMQANPTLYPKECTNGVVFVKSGDGENGWSWARIRCK